MERLLTVVRKEFIHIFRDWRTLAIIIILPAFLLLLLGYGVSGDSSNIALAVADLSKTDASRRYLEYFTAPNEFEVKYDVLTEEEILLLLDEELVTAGILIPEDFGRKLDLNQSTEVQFYVNGSDPSAAQSANLKLETIAQVATQKILTEQLTQAGSAIGFSITELPVTTYTKTLYNPDGSDKIYMIPGLTAIVLQVQALLLTALAIVREREQGTMEQLIVTPIKSWELVLGKIIPYLVVGIFNTIATLLISVYIFGITVQGSFWLLVLLTIPFIIGSLGLGVLISNISRTQMQAMYLAVGIVLIPAIILSGLIFSREGMPPFTYWFSEILPVTHYLVIIRGIMVKGVGVDFLLTSILKELGLGLIFFIASVIAFRKKI
ncbi:MAG: ABC transporter permease [Anaerolineae bacterium]|jgi:ABC-2 type transport system permease protein|nr:ABC transporter permease [Anaerolineae bacterium]